jgi:hypothetical protein
VKVVLRGIRRTIGTVRAGKAPATADLIGQMLALCLVVTYGGCPAADGALAASALHLQNTY